MTLTAPHAARVLGREAHAEKIQPGQWERLAVVYVRQSTVQQVLAHQESTRLQYELRTRAQDLGWTAERVLVIDDDLGKSGVSTAGRLGFQRLVSEVSLGHVGIILGIEMSRLARSCADWYHLLELCALFGTLIADVDGVYDPAQYNDRLLLGLKGTMSEAELHVLRQRLQQGRLSKARRGELTIPVPTGYVRQPSGEVVFDPDEQVQHVVRLIFHQFEELGTLNAVLRYLVRHDVRLGIRVREGPAKGDLAWRRPTRATLQTLLKHPIYAGAYAYGRRRIDPQRKKPGQPHTGRVLAPPREWYAFLPERFPAYISWEQYERNLARLQANQARADTLGAVRAGTALLSGLLACGRCGCRLTVRYRGTDKAHTYVCGRHMTDYGAALCQQLAGPCLDQYVSAQVLTALEPAALELSLEAAEQVERERADLDRLWQQRRERAAYEAQRARRQYDAVEPENRLVARHLERAWEEKLAAQQHLAEEYQRFLATQPRGLSEEERGAIRQLAADIPALWHAPTTTLAERKEIIRQVVQRVEVTVQGDSERVGVALTWAGGLQTEGEVVRPVARFSQLSYYAALCEQVEQGAAAGLSSTEMAHRLNAAGYRPPKRCAQFTGPIVQDLLRQLQGRERRRHPPRADGPGPHEWWLADLARLIGMPPVTLDRWRRRGWLTARQEQQPPHRWIVWANEREVARLRELHQRPAGYATRRRWVDEEGEGCATTGGHQANEAPAEAP
jgi:DNA invertase Pin-like site-specific DNA recombinase